MNLPGANDLIAVNGKLYRIPAAALEAALGPDRRPTLHRFTFIGDGLRFPLQVATQRGTFDLVPVDGELHQEHPQPGTGYHGSALVGIISVHVEKPAQPYGPDPTP